MRQMEVNDGPRPRFWDSLLTKISAPFWPFLWFAALAAFIQMGTAWMNGSRLGGRKALLGLALGVLGHVERDVRRRGS